MSAIQATVDFRLNDFWLKVYQLAVFLQVVKILRGSSSAKALFLLHLATVARRVVGSTVGLSYMENQRHTDVQARPGQTRCTKPKNKTKSLD